MEARMRPISNEVMSIEERKVHDNGTAVLRTCCIARSEMFRKKQPNAGGSRAAVSGSWRCQARNLYAEQTESADPLYWR